MSQPDKFGESRACTNHANFILSTNNKLALSAEICSVHARINKLHNVAAFNTLRALIQMYFTDYQHLILVSNSKSSLIQTQNGGLKITKQNNFNDLC